MSVGSGVLLLPNYAEDIKYPAYNDRLLMKSMGAQAGVVEAEDFKVSAGTGLQVNVKKGKAFVEQTKAIEESENTFYNGFYNALNPIEQNPYNNVEVPSTNPQIAQIVIRVYDVGELKIGGESFVRLEWVNGSSNALATEAKMKEGVYEGRAALPQSSYRLANVLVPKNATKSSEYYIEDARRMSSKSFLQCREVSGNFTISNGELVQAETENATITLPKNAPTNTIVGVFAGANNIKISTSNGILINGEVFSSIKLSTNQSVIMQVQALGSWAIIAGERKNENIYESQVERASETEYEASSIRPVFVVLEASYNHAAIQFMIVTCAGQRIGSYQSSLQSGEVGVQATTMSFICPPGKKWKAQFSGGATPKLVSSYLKL